MMQRDLEKSRYGIGALPRCLAALSLADDSTPTRRGKQ
jgi:hypothetical protein